MILAKNKQYKKIIVAEATKSFLAALMIILNHSMLKIHLFKMIH